MEYEYGRPERANWLRPEECVDRHIYGIKSRNLRYGIWREDVEGFVGLREKHDSLYPFTEFHYDTGGMFGTACPYVDLGLVPEDLDIRENLDTVCALHGRLADFDINRPEGERWRHTDDGSIMDFRAPSKDYGIAPANQVFTNWLIAFEREHDWYKIMGMDRV